MCRPPTRFPSLAALARLPWFELEAGNLTLVDPTVGPIIDAHTHLALTFFRRRSVDLFAAPRPTEYYLPRARDFDLDIYCNKNFTDEDLARLKMDLAGRCFIAAGMRTTHTVPNLLEEMRALGIVTSILLPIDLPCISHNAEVFLNASRRADGISSLGSVHPFDWDLGDRLERQKGQGAFGVKVHPAVQMVRPDHPRALELYRLCAELGLPVLWHCGPVGIESRAARERCQLERYWRAVRACPDTTFVLGHAGALQMESALELSQSYPNIYLELSSQSVGNVRKIVTEAPIERVVFGSDWPFYPQAIGVAKVLLATRDRPELRSLVLHDNAARLFSLPAATETVAEPALVSAAPEELL